MNTSGIFITADHVKSLSKDEQAFLFKLIGGNFETGNLRETMQETATDTDAVYDHHFVEFSPGQAREFYAGCNEKTRKAVEVIARSDKPFFQLAAVADAIGVAAPELRGVWSGLTRRARTLTGDAGAYLIDWSKGEAIYDDDGAYSDQRGEVTELTYKSFRKALGIA
ncbi:hypothetical protein [Rhizobium leguminosarum]|uniref:hypothetical protein n=1 Tax=Rhizobium leguminosarum TaxID=384 RepID=UPI001030F61F|nr:hypothetical protein [Rhizobium leguminosarum]TAY99670.1 hypothetical protein ELH79_14795 [Rhizobium leguminosarum]TAZ10540.1 hypothetical protein ELH78_15680 [Rhizobium leguminosarum]